MEKYVLDVHQFVSIVDNECHLIDLYSFLSIDQQEYENDNQVYF
jgi:hypothetical protein